MTTIGQLLPPPHKDEPRQAAGWWERLWRVPEVLTPGEAFSLRLAQASRDLDQLEMLAGPPLDHPEG